MPLDFIKTKDPAIRQIKELLALKLRVNNIERFPAKHLVSGTRLCSIVNEVFAASLLVEEGRSSRASIVLREIELSTSFFATTPAIFKAPVPFSRQTIAKLAPICTRRSLALAVSCDATGQASIWGLCDESSSFSCRMTITDVARVLVNVSGEDIAVFDAVNGSTFIGGKFTGGLMGYLWSAIDSLVNDDSKSQPVAYVLADTVSSAIRLARGGTLLIVPDDTRLWQRSIQKPIALGFQPDFDPIKMVIGEKRDIVEEMRGDAKKKDHSRQNDRDWERKYAATMQDLERRERQEAQRLADLTLIDGAVIVSTSLAILAVGAKIAPTLGQAYTKQVLRIDPFVDDEPQKIPMEKLGGTRHASAVQFVNENRDCLAIVISQDKRLSVFRWNKDRDLISYLRLDALA